MSFAGPAVFVAENIDAEELINYMNSDDNDYEGYLKALENLFGGKAESELSKNKILFSSTRERWIYTTVFKQAVRTIQYRIAEQIKS